MINNTIIRLLRADYRQNIRNEEISFKSFCIKAILGTSISRSHTWIFWFRISSFPNKIIASLAKRRLSHYSVKYGIDIPYNTKIGGGLYLGHGMNIVINDGTIIGKNANISHFVNIGTNHNTPAIIGDNVYIGPMTCIVEDVKIGDNVTIGAGSVVTKDIPDNATVAGVPAKVLNFDNPGRYIYMG